MTHAVALALLRASRRLGFGLRWPRLMDWAPAVRAKTARAMMMSIRRWSIVRTEEDACECREPAILT